MTTSAVILAAGRGNRMQAGQNKIFLPILGVPLLQHTLSAFHQIPEVDEIVIVLHHDDVDRAQRLANSIVENCRFAEGGATRRDSSLAGIRAATGEIVLIHDAARPFPSRDLILRVMAAARDVGASIPVLPVFDLLHRVDSATSRIRDAAVVDAAHLVRAQTPQGFRRDLILDCLERAPAETRDDATAAHLAGHPVATVAGDPANLKVTHRDDLPLAEAIAAARA